jgi:hypothetical protein
MLPEGHRTFCGLVAISQILVFHRYPERGRGHSEAYTMSNGAIVPALDFNIAYDWDNMLNSYRSDGRDSTEQQRNAAATLIYHAGVARGRDFIAGGNRNSWPVVFTTTFGYDRSIQWLNRAFYNDAEWFALIRQQLDAGLPVIYSGDEPGSDHTFIVDGYDSQDRFHINWGWSGRYNGWYSLDDLNYAGVRRFYDNHSMVINIKPDRGGVSADWEMALMNYTTNKTSVSQNEMFTVSARVRNVSSLDVFPGGRFGAALVDSNGNITAIIGDRNASVRNPNTSTSATPFDINCFVPDTVKPGQYRLMIVVRPEGGDWQIITKSAIRNGVLSSKNITVTAGVANSGGYGMGLVSFNTDKNTVSHNEQFTVTFMLRNMGQERFPGGQSGVALVNNGNIIEVMGIGNTNERGVGGTTATITRRCTVPDTVVTGFYQLRIVIRTTGNEWRIATMSVNNAPISIDFTVR